jgi:flagellar motor switch protein FliM
VEPILTKTEIADLLAAIRAGKVSTDLVDDKPPLQRLAAYAKEIDLLRVYERSRDSSELRIPNLDIVLDTFARRFSTSLTNNLLRNFNVNREEIASTNFQQAILDLKNQGAIGIYGLPPLRYGCLLHCDTLLAFTLLEIMLGSSQSSESLALDRNLTTIEMAILRTIMTDICTEMEQALLPLVACQPYLNRLENNFRLVNIVEPEAEVLTCRFTVRMSGEISGQMRLIIPYLTLEPLREKFKDLVNITQMATNTWTETILEEIMDMESPVTARSGALTMSIRRLLSLRPGDILDLPYNPDRPLTLFVEEQPIFFAIPGEVEGKKAVHITGQYHPAKRGVPHGNS